ncbi:MAG: two-component system, cell cycle response regulator [Solirubrobacteraceae bacterium]|nr:two-component system, cell cycle response regulator [Solirubrobacteraceae bacterium]
MSAAAAGAAAALREETADDLYEHAPCAYVSALMDGTIVKCNGTFLTWTGHHRDDVVGRMRFRDLLTPGGRILHETHHVPLLLMQGAVRDVALDIVGADGRRVPTLMSSSLRRDAAGRPVVVRSTLFHAGDRAAYERELRRARDRERGAREAAEARQEQLALRNDRLERLAYTDPLTAVANRRALDEQLRTAVRHVRRHGGALGVVLVDIDHFKRINDGFGHDCGDNVLRTVARRMREVVREDDVVGRLGGEEFLIIARETGPDGLQRLAERLRGAVAAAPIACAGASVPVTVSAGWAAWEGESPEALLGRADRALYTAKESGRDAVRGAVARTHPGPGAIRGAPGPRG